MASEKIGWQPKGLAAAAVACLLAALAGCGSSSTAGKSGGGGPIPGESTVVTLTASSAANDQLQAFQLFVNSLTLSDKAGNSITVVGTPQELEFIHLNGGAEPVLTASLPQGVYTSAAATVGAADFVCATQQGGGLDTSTYAYGYTPTGQVTVNMPDPITVEGSTMALNLDLQVSQSASFPSTCYVNGSAQYEITPTFNLAVMDVAAEPTSAANGKLTALQGVVGNTSANGFTMVSADGSGSEILQTGISQTSSALQWQVSTNSSTAFQGVAGLGALAAGMPVDLDANLQANGSLVATRVAVYDTDTTTASAFNATALFSAASLPVVNTVDHLWQGPLGPVLGGWTYSIGNAAFQSWGGLTNVASLPFTASFSSENLVPGQNLEVTTHVTAPENYPLYVPAATITLMPQTVNGMVGTPQTVGSFTVYPVTLAAYDLFPQLADQPGQNTLLTNPQTVMIYVDANTGMANTQALAAGSVMRFTGVVFNDNGTLRMDCIAVNDGVAE